MQKTAIVILAAGFGKRMQSETPKVLSLLHGRPLIAHLLDAVKASGVSESPVVVVGQKRELVMAAVTSECRECRYAVQEAQMGTGDAVRAAESLLKTDQPPAGGENVMVLYGDMPYVSADTIKALADTQETSGGPLTMATVTVPDFEGWRAGFYDFSRVVRDEAGKIVRTVEKKDATAEELLITEVNPCYFSFNASWLWENLPKVKNENAQGEYYLTDLVSFACKEGLHIASVAIEPKESIGVNTREHLELLHEL